MLRPWMNMLPVFVLRKIAEHKCEVLNVGGAEFYVGTRGVLFLKRKLTTGE